MRAAVLREARAPLALEQREPPSPGPGEVLVRVRACGVCHSDLHLAHGWFPFAAFPVVPGHEVAGEVEAVGEGVESPAVGTRVGMPWLYSSCGACDLCIRGEEVMCPQRKVSGVSVDGGYADYMIAPAGFAAPLPDNLSFEQAAPIMCAGLTVFSAIRDGGFRPGDRVAVLGLGGLGEFAIGYARAMGGRVAVLSRGRAKAEEARELGAELFVDTEADDPGNALAAWDGGANLIVSTVPASEPVSAAFPGLAPDGTCVVVGLAAEPIGVRPGHLISGRRRLMGSATGSRKDLRDALAFAAAHGVRARTTAYGLDDALRVWGELEGGRVHGRAVLVNE